ncbi:DUF3038 domain-containing protein [Geminocystis sp. NIES-3709]|uniref:DUF3038 domain-containing protein n=1 Tax=Geminocystis sp. NIES-3709 TaxID=1617448 RepID=UPI0005FCB5A2|nr:DUF3038 domain-containing protein [Geminocystis sp. NIES-3709]BAQ66688.1 hypothetical protein GM3709_3453 [Geminocystis sp. NIES-3709]
MTQSASLMTESNSELITEDKSQPAILQQLPDFPLPATGGMMKLQQHLDLLLLALEALQLGGSEYMLATATELGLNKIIKNRIILWRLRCTNPWRKCYTRESLTITQAKTMVFITSECAKKFTIPLRQLLVAVQQMKDKNMPLENNFRLSEYFTRFQSHFISRMNPRRAKVSVYISSPEQLNELALSLLEELLFCTGVKGKERFWVSLFDGEVK